MRIIGGDFRGTHLADLGRGDMAAHLRPTTDRVRESIFNLLINGALGNVVDGAHVLDLFAGTGALGLEALSRGAQRVTFVDDGKKAQTLIRDNIKRCRAEDRTALLARDAMTLGAPKNSYDLVFCDPPYGKGLGVKALANCHAQGWLSDGAVVVLEEGQAMMPPLGFVEQDQRRYGDSLVHIWRVAHDA